MLELLTHKVSYTPDRIEQGRWEAQRKAMQPKPRQISLQTVLVITTLFCGACAAVSGYARSSLQDGSATSQKK